MLSIFYLNLIINRVRRSKEKHTILVAGYSCDLDSGSVVMEIQADFGLKKHNTKVTSFPCALLRITAAVAGGLWLVSISLLSFGYGEFVAMDGISTD